MDLSKAKHAFVTGGASGLGLAIADALAARGLKVTLADIQPDLIEAVLAARDERYRGAVLDVRDREGWARAKAEAEAAFGPVDVLVNNAGIAPNGQHFADMSPDSFDMILAINLVGVVNGVFAFAADMRERGFGHIVNTASQAGLSVNAPGVGAYAVAKFGVVALSEGSRKELAPHGVGVSALCPGWVPTGLGENTARIGGKLSASGHGGMPPTEISADELAAMVIDGIERDAAYIMTHKGTWAQVEPRMAAIREACEVRTRG